MNGEPIVPFAALSRSDELNELPEEVREAIEVHKNEIHSEEDLRDLAHDLMMRR